MDKFFKIRLFSQPLAGRELLLPTGLFTIGNGDCDLELATTNNIIIEINISDDEITLSNVEDCFVNGSPHSIALLPLNKYIELSGVGFVLGRSDDDLSLVQPVEKSKQKKSKKISLAVLFSSIALLGIFVFVLLIFFLMPKYNLGSKSKALPYGSQKLTEQKLTNQVTGLMKFNPDIKYKWIGANIVELTGFCIDESKLNQMLTLFTSDGIHIVRKVNCYSELKRNISNVLSNYGASGYRIEIKSDGNVNIFGDIFSNSNYLDVVSSLDRLVGVGRWTTTSTTKSEFGELMELLAANELLSGVSVRQSNAQWVITADASTSEEAVFKKLSHHIKTNFSNEISIPVIFLNIKEKLNTTDYIPAMIKEIDGNKNYLYAELEDGTRLIEGDILSNGYKIVKISKSGISITNDLQLIFLSMYGSSSYTH
jgi:type III secretion system YscD/HrpQ family protein